MEKVVSLFVTRLLIVILIVIKINAICKNKLVTSAILSTEYINISLTELKLEYHGELKSILIQSNQNFTHIHSEQLDYEAGNRKLYQNHQKSNNINSLFQQGSNIKLSPVWLMLHQICSHRISII